MLPLITVFVPVTNFDTFKSGLRDGSPLKERGNSERDFPERRFRGRRDPHGQAGDISGDEKQKVTAWAPPRAAPRN